jgi:hypothetical protein
LGFDLFFKLLEPENKEDFVDEDEEELESDNEADGDEKVDDNDDDDEESDDDDEEEEIDEKEVEENKNRVKKLNGFISNGVEKNDEASKSFIYIIQLSFSLPLIEANLLWIKMTKRSKRTSSTVQC